VTRVEEKCRAAPPIPVGTTPASTAAALLLDYARRLAPSERGEYELPQALAQMVRDGRAVRARPVLGFWCDVGTPADLEWANAELSSPVAARLE
jgi:glucose-1-phosphate thymidylyltransferase